jgi:hypothetical protein
MARCRWSGQRPGIAARVHRDVVGPFGSPATAGGAAWAAAHARCLTRNGSEPTVDPVVSVAVGLLSAPGPAPGPVGWQSSVMDTFTRAEERPDGDERGIALGWLAFHRDALAAKCRGLTDDQLVDRSAPPSALSLLGVVRHMAEMERAYGGWASGGCSVAWAPHRMAR